MRMRLDWKFVSLVLVGMAGVAYLASRPNTGNSGVVLSDVPAPPSHQSTPATTSEAPKPASVESKPSIAAVPTRNLAAELAAATDFRRFAVAAAQHPEIGGISYAMHAAGTCHVLETILPAYGLEKTDTIPYRPNEDPAAYAARVKSLEAARRNCASYTPGEGLRLDDLAKSQGDVLYALGNRFNEARKSSDANAKSSAIAAILASKDPLLLSQTLQRMMLDRNEANQLGYWLDGQFTPNAESDALVAAIKTIPCRYGLPCDINDLDVMQSCLGGSGCFESREAMLTAPLSQEQRAKYEALMQRLKTVIDTGDVAALTRRK